jgi:hypothetical protein
MAGFEVTPYGRFCLTPEADSSPAIVYPQPEMEVWDRSREPGEGCERCDSVENESDLLIQFMQGSR